MAEDKKDEKKGTEIDLKQGPIGDIIDLLGELDKLRRRTDSGEINNETAKLELNIMNTMMRGAALNLKFQSMRKFLPGNLPILRRDTKALSEKDDKEKPPEKPNGSSKKDETHDETS